MFILINVLFTLTKGKTLQKFNMLTKIPNNIAKLFY